MRAIVEGLLLALPFYLLCGFGVATFVAFRRQTAPWLRRWRYLLAAAFVGSFIVGTPACANTLMYRLEHRYPPRLVTASDRHPDNLILVLTAGWFRWDGRRLDVKLS